MCGGLTTIIFIVLAGAVMVFFTFLNYTLTVSHGSPGGAAVGIVNSIAIIALNEVFKMLAAMLTTWENHRTETEFHDNLIVKCVSFQFICSFFGMYLIAFLKPWADAQHPAGMNPLTNVFSPAHVSPPALYPILHPSSLSLYQNDQ